MPDAASEHGALTAASNRKQNSDTVCKLCAWAAKLAVMNVSVLEGACKQVKQTRRLAVCTEEPGGEAGS
jgi:hypothetical protein